MQLTKHLKEDSVAFSFITVKTVLFWNFAEYLQKKNKKHQLVTI